MPYHPDSTTRTLFIRNHVHTPVTIEQVICSFCRQRCTRHHKFVQISGHPECQCVFGKTCLLQWLESGSASSNTCPSCRAVLYNANANEDGNDGEEMESDGDDINYDDEEESTKLNRGRPTGILGNSSQRRRSHAPSPSPSRFSASSSSSDASISFPRRAHHTHSYNLRPRPSRQESSSPRTSSIGSTVSTLSNIPIALGIDLLVDDLWAGTWDLVYESRKLTADNATRSRSITRAQLIMLIMDVWPFDDVVEAAVLEHLVIRARKMVRKHRSNGEKDGDSELRVEREDVTMAVGYDL